MSPDFPHLYTTMTSSRALQPTNWLPCMHRGLGDAFSIVGWRSALIGNVVGLTKHIMVASTPGGNRPTLCSEGQVRAQHPGLEWDGAT